jgi:hypothetical protein
MILTQMKFWEWHLIIIHEANHEKFPMDRPSFSRRANQHNCMYWNDGLDWDTHLIWGIWYVKNVRPWTLTTKNYVDLSGGQQVTNVYSVWWKTLWTIFVTRDIHNVTFILYDLEFSSWLSTIKFSQATSHVRWLKDEKTNVSRNISVLVLRVLM